MAGFLRGRKKKKKKKKEMNRSCNHLPLPYIWVISYSLIDGFTQSSSFVWHWVCAEHPSPASMVLASTHLSEPAGLQVSFAPPSAAGLGGRWTTATWRPGPTSFLELPSFCRTVSALSNQTDNALVTAIADLLTSVDASSRFRGALSLLWMSALTDDEIRRHSESLEQGTVIPRRSLPT